MIGSNFTWRKDYPSVINRIKKNNKSAKIISMFTNVFWDAQLHFKDNIFKDMLTWIHETINILILKKIYI